QRRAGLDHDALDLEALASVDRVVATPRSVDLAMEGVFLPTGLLDVVDDALDVLHAVLARDQGGVLGIDDYQILDTDRGDHSSLGGPHQVVAAVQRQHVSLEAIAVRVMLSSGPQRRPGTDVAPTTAHRYHRSASGLLHHRVVDRVRWAGGEGILIHPDEV